MSLTAKSSITLTMIIMMALLPASVLMTVGVAIRATVGVATKVTGTAAVVGVIEDAGKTPVTVGVASRVTEEWAMEVTGKVTVCTV